ncbi:MAG TPA: DUF4249 domain-containing protein [Chryseosolibacter sp.]
MKILRLLPLVFLFTDACIERLELPAPENQPRIVVDGLLTDVLGTHSVRLFRTGSLASKVSEVTPVLDATVTLLDNFGNSFDFGHTGNGVYSIRNFKGEIGRKYQLRFNTDDGKHYASTVQELMAGGTITDLNYQFVENAINRDDPAAPHDVFRIYVDSKAQSDQAALFRWRWTSVYEALTFPQLRKKPKPDTTPVIFIYDPIPCSGHIAVAGGVAIAQMAPCECCTCWVTNDSETSMVSNNQFVTNPEFYNVQVAQIPVDWIKFQAKFYIKVEQLSLSEEVYEFWKNVQAQQEGTANIFQPNVIRIRGNISCVSDPSEDVAGIFSVAGSTERELFIERKAIPKVLYADTIINDCRKQYPGSTNVKPLFW